MGTSVPIYRHYALVYNYVGLGVAAPNPGKPSMVAAMTALGALFHFQEDNLVVIVPFFHIFVNRLFVPQGWYNSIERVFPHSRYAPQA